jgi:hypothetical protein
LGLVLAIVLLVISFGVRAVAGRLRWIVTGNLFRW